MDFAARMSDLETWAWEQFGTADLGDARRTKRLVSMLVGAARRPSGKVSNVFDRGNEREGAYDFLENEAVEAKEIAGAMFATTVSKARGERFAYVVVDGSSIALTDEAGEKDFGPIGSPNRPTRGLKVMNALAVDKDGVPLGLVDQLFWARPPCQKRTFAERLHDMYMRDFDEKETRHFRDVAKNAIDRLANEDVRSWVVIDREGDNQEILRALAAERCSFTVRAKYNRPTTEEKQLRDVLAKQPVLGSYRVDVARSGKRAARAAQVDVRAKTLELKLRRRREGQATLRLTAVWVHENEEREDALDWLLFTNIPVTNTKEARQVVESYRMRWRIEELHRTWKSGECNVEDGQLRSKEAVVKWATILVAVAVRIERLKYLSRNVPDALATVELTEIELEALKLDQGRRRPGAKKKEKLPAKPTIEQATRWIAELGGWIGPANGPPGAITLARGLDRLAMLVDAILLVRQHPQGGRRT